MPRVASVRAAPHAAHLAGHVGGEGEGGPPECAEAVVGAEGEEHAGPRRPREAFGSGAGAKGKERAAREISVRVTSLQRKRSGEDPASSR